MEGSRELRVSDQQRERAAQELREHFAAGRLTEDELSKRVQAAYGARTESQLRELLGDLPRLPATPQQLRAELAERRGHLQRRLHSFFWPIWVLLIVVIPLIRNGWRLYGPSPQLDRVERELERRAGHDDRRRPRGRY